MRRILPILLLFALFIAPAHAAGGVIDVGQALNSALAPYVNAIVQALVAAVVTWAAWKFKQKTGIDIDAGHREAFTRALQNQASSLIADGMARMDGVKVSVDSAALARAANDLLASIPDAAAHFGLTPDFVAKRIVDMIPQTTGGAEMVAQAHAPEAAAEQNQNR